MLASLGFWLLSLLVILAFMAIYNHEPRKSEPKKPTVIPRPVLVPRNVSYQPRRTVEQELAAIQAEYERKFALLDTAIPDPIHRQSAQRELYSRYLKRIESLM